MDSDEKWQNCIDQLVLEISGPTKSPASESTVDEFIKQAETRNPPYGKGVQDGFWITDYNIFDRGEIGYIDSYDFYEEFCESGVISIERVEKILKGSKLTDEEFKAFTGWWSLWSLDDPHWEKIHVYDIQELSSRDGNSCIIVISDQEGDHIHMGLKYTIYGFFPTKDEAVANLRCSGLLDMDKDNNEILAAFIERACSSYGV